MFLIFVLLFWVEEGCGWEGLHKHHCVSKAGRWEGKWWYYNVKYSRLIGCNMDDYYLFIYCLFFQSREVATRGHGRLPLQFWPHKHIHFVCGAYIFSSVIAYKQTIQSFLTEINKRSYNCICFIKRLVARLSNLNSNNKTKGTPRLLVVYFVWVTGNYIISPWSHERKCLLTSFNWGDNQYNH